VFPAELGRFIYWVPVLELLKIFAQNSDIYHINDSTSAYIIHFIYILGLVLEDVTGSDVGGGGFFGPHCKFGEEWQNALDGDRRTRSIFETMNDVKDISDKTNGWVGLRFATPFVADFRKS